MSRRTRRWCVAVLVLRASVADHVLPAQAVAYFKLAADLGDPDAQTELAFCYANGKGCKKDMKLAAKVRFFRLSSPRFYLRKLYSIIAWLSLKEERRLACRGSTR